MKTTQNTRDNKKQTHDTSVLAAGLAAAQEVNIPRTRTVTLLYQSCCGCGCSDIKVEREVPYDSPLQDGDRITKLEDNDKW